MNKKNIFLLVPLLTTLLNADSLKIDSMFENAKVDGTIKILYNNVNLLHLKDSYSTASGLLLSYNLAKYNGMSGGFTFNTTKDIGLLSGDNESYNKDLSSSTGNYTKLTKLFVDYEYQNFKITLGRQQIDTPLADSDDIRMIANSFEAITMTYKYHSFKFLLSDIIRWQGTDVGLDNGWVKTGENGTFTSALIFENEKFIFNLWYYNISKQADIIYSDISIPFSLTDEIDGFTNLQYLYESELEKSEISSSIYGFSLEVSGNNVSYYFAYNKSLKQKNKHSFSGFGGGTLVTNMDTMILDEIAEDRAVDVFATGFTYNINQIDFSYAIGIFKGDKNSIGQKENILEQNFGIDYQITKDMLLNAVFVIDKNQENGDSDDYNMKNFRTSLTYNF